MADVFDKEKRSDIMRRIKSNKNKSTELRLIEVFRENHIIGWRRNYPVKGHPDFVFLDRKVAVFVDGCFWHGHDCRNTRPSDNQDFWNKNREKNIKHYREITERFADRGWIVLRIWECELKKKNRELLISRLQDILGDVPSA